MQWLSVKAHSPGFLIYALHSQQKVKLHKIRVFLEKNISVDPTFECLKSLPIQPPKRTWPRVRPIKLQWMLYKPASLFLCRREALVWHLQPISCKNSSNRLKAWPGRVREDLLTKKHRFLCREEALVWHLQHSPSHARTIVTDWKLSQGKLGKTYWPKALVSFAERRHLVDISNPACLTQEQ